MKKVFACCLLGISMILGACVSESEQIESVSSVSQETVVQEETFQVLHIMSYHEGWEWTEVQLQGFQDALSEYEVE